MKADAEKTMAWSGEHNNLEAHDGNSRSQPPPRSRLLHVLLLFGIIGSAVTFYSILGALIFCHYYSEDASSSLLGLVASSVKFSNYPRPTTFSPFHAFSKSDITLFKKPDDIEVVAVVDYRNWERSSILNCYLQKNLVEYGGLLDKVIFVPETTDPIHLEWLHETVNKTDSYSVLEDILYSFSEVGPSGIYNDHSLYVHIDGDVVYIEENVIPTVVNTKLQHPNMGIVSANVIHQPAVAEFHRKLGMTMPNLADLGSLDKDLETVDDQQQRNSFSPCWKNVLTIKWQNWLLSQDQPMSGKLNERKQHYDSNQKRLNPKSSSTSATARYDWISQAQQHNSFLHHLEHDGDFRAYKFPMWKNPPGKVSVSFICGTSADIASFATTNSAASKEGQKVVIDGKGVVSHYDHLAGLEGLDATNVLGRYKRYAEENVCLL